MKIMHLVLTPRLSGAEILARDLCIAQKGMGHITAFSSINPCEESFISEVDKLKDDDVVIQVPSITPTYIQRIIRIKKILNEFKPDIVFAHSVIPAMYARISDPFRRRTIPVLHATENYPKGSLHRAVEHILCYLSRSTIAVSKEGAENYQQAFPNPIHVVINGLNFADAKVASDHRRQRLERTKIAIQVGRVLPVKGQHISIQAMADVVKIHPDSELWIVGLIEDKDYYERIKNMITDLNLTASVKFLGPRSDIFKLLSVADVFLMPSSAESQGLAMLEALSVGIPVVASDIPVLKQFEIMPEVICVPIADPSAWAASIVESFKGATFSLRDLSLFDIERTASEYINLAVTV